MKCPQLIFNVLVADGEWEDVPKDCIKKKCGHWDKFGNQCNELSKTAELKLIRETLQEIRDRLPKRY